MTYERGLLPESISGESPEALAIYVVKFSSWAARKNLQLTTALGSKIVVEMVLPIDFTGEKSEIPIPAAFKL